MRSRLGISGPSSSFRSRSRLRPAHRSPPASSRAPSPTPPGAVLPGATVEARNTGTNLSRTQTTEADGRYIVPAAATRHVSRDVHAAGLRHARPRRACRSPSASRSRCRPRCRSRRRRNDQRQRRAPASSNRRERPSATTLNALTVEHIPNLGRKFEDLLTLTPGVSIVQGPDGDEITFAGQRGIFNNISLDGGDYNNGFFGEQAGGQRVGGGHHARGDQGVPGDRHRRAGGVRPHRGRRRQRHHEVGHEHGARQPVPLPAARGADRRAVGRHEPRRLPSRAVGRHVRRADQEGQGVLLRRARGDHRELQASEPRSGSSATRPARSRTPTSSRTRR